MVFGSTILDVAIGVTFIYLLLSVICTAANEAVEGILKGRAALLAEGIRTLLGSQELQQKLYSHGLICGIRRKKSKQTGNPSYISAPAFASALLDVLLPDGKLPPQSQLAETIRELESVYGKQITQSLLALLRRADDRGRDLRGELEDWYDSSMERVSGWYKRRSYVANFIIATVIVVGSNADTLRIAQHLSSDPARRSMIVAAATEYSKTKAPAPHSERSADPKADLDRAVKDMTAAASSMQELGVPLGWASDGPGTMPGALFAFQKLLGLLLTTVAVTLGAPFWFDVLNKFMVVRSTVKPEEKSQVEASKDPPKRLSAETTTANPEMTTSNAVRG